MHSLRCDQPTVPPSAELDGASHFAFRCIDLSTEPAQIAPLDRCGCLSSELTSSGRSISSNDPETCAQEGRYEIVGYVGSATQEKVGVLRLEQTNRGVLDIDQSIPGISHISASGLITQLGVHPYGDFLYLVHGDEGVSPCFLIIELSAQM